MSRRFAGVSLASSFSKWSASCAWRNPSMREISAWMGGDVAATRTTMRRTGKIAS